MLFRKKINFNTILTVIVLTSILSACSSRKALINTFEIKPMSAGKIIRKLERESPTYKTYESNRITANYKDNESKNVFTAQFKIDRDECIILTLRKLNMPIARCYVATDSVKLVNYMEKSYIVDDVASLQKIFGLDLEYNFLQALLTGDVSSLLSEDALDKELNSYIDENMYRIDSEFSNKISKALSKGKERRLSRYMTKMDDSEFINYTVWIDPQYFVIKKLAFKNIKNNEDLVITYDQYELVGRSLFPQNINMEFSSPSKEMDLSMKLYKPSVNKEKDFKFSIPEKYERYYLSKN